MKFCFRIFKNKLISLFESLKCLQSLLSSWFLREVAFSFKVLKVLSKRYFCLWALPHCLSSLFHGIVPNTAKLNFCKKINKQHLCSCVDWKLWGFTSYLTDLNRNCNTNLYFAWEYPLFKWKLFYKNKYECASCISLILFHDERFQEGWEGSQGFITLVGGGALHSHLSQSQCIWGLLCGVAAEGILSGWGELSAIFLFIRQFLLPGRIKAWR